MKIFAKKNSQLENLMKGFYEQMESEKKIIPEIVKEFTGVEPEDFGYYWYFGVTCRWAYDMFIFPENSTPKNMIPYVSERKTRYKPNKRLKDSKEFIKKWNEKFKGLDGDVLSEYGLPIYDREIGIYSHWIPIKEDDRYGIEVSSSLIDRLPKIKNKQYEIDL